MSNKTVWIFLNKMVATFYLFINNINARTKIFYTKLIILMLEPTQNCNFFLLPLITQKSRYFIWNGFAYWNWLLFMRIIHSKRKVVTNLDKFGERVTDCIPFVYENDFNLSAQSNYVQAATRTACLSSPRYVRGLQ